MTKPKPHPTHAPPHAVPIWIDGIDAFSEAIYIELAPGLIQKYTFLELSKVLALLRTKSAVVRPRGRSKVTLPPVKPKAPRPAPAVQSNIDRATELLKKKGLL